MSRLVLAMFAAASVLFASSVAHADKVHSYTFNDASPGVGGITDSAGSQHGTLIDPAGTYGVISGGRLDLTSNNGVNSNQTLAGDPTNFTQGAYIDLPDAILNGAINGGDDNAVSIETWFTVDENRAWSRLWDFGTSDEGEDASTAGTNSDFLAFAPLGGGAASNGASVEMGSAARTTPVAVLDTESRLVPDINGEVPAGPGPIPVGTQQHVIVTFDADDPTGGSAGTVRFYFNGVDSGVGELNPQLSLVFDDFANILGDPDRFPTNNWIGRSQWNNPLFDGWIDEFNIYDEALDADQAMDAFTAGPTPFSGPTVVVNRGTGEITLVNGSGAAQGVVTVTITSAVEGLAPGGLDAPSAFDLASPATASTINLEDTDGPGANLPGDATPVSLGDIWLPSPFEDVEATFQLNGGFAGLTATVEYTGDPVLRSDFDLDGDVDRSDFNTFVANAGTSVSGIAGYYLGDIDLNGFIDRNDYRLFRDDFFAAGGTAAAFASFASSLAPEPSAGAMLIIALAFGRVARRR